MFKSHLEFLTVPIVTGIKQVSLLTCAMWLTVSIQFCAHVIDRSFNVDNIV